MSPQRQDSNFEGMNALPVTMRGPHQHSNFHPEIPYDRSLIDEDVARHYKRMESLLPLWEERGWFYDPVLMCWRWADHLLSDEEREMLGRAREACALEEVGA